MLKKFVKSIITKTIHETLLKKIKKQVSEILEKQWLQQVRNYTIIFALVIFAVFLDRLISFYVDTHQWCKSFVYVGVSGYFLVRSIQMVNYIYRLVLDNWSEYKKARTVKQFLCFYALHRYEMVAKIYKNIDDKRLLGVDLSELIPSLEELVEEVYQYFRKQVLLFVILMVVLSFGVRLILWVLL